MTLLHDRAERWFERASAALLAALPCGRGCHQCCIGLFAITRLDADRLTAALRALPPDHADRIRSRARSQRTALEAAHPALRETKTLDRWADADVDAAAAQFSAERCPALEDDGSCAVYADRPMTCRMMGIPLEEDGVVRGACAVQTAVPIVRLPTSHRKEEDRLTELEARALESRPSSGDGDEVWLPYGFLVDGDEDDCDDALDDRLDRW